MATVSFTIPDAQLTRVLDGIAITRDYEGRKLDGETKAQFAKRMVKEDVKAWVVGAESSAGAVTAGETANSEIDIQD